MSRMTPGEFRAFIAGMFAGVGVLFLGFLLGKLLP